jgi:protein kinase A
MTSLPQIIAKNRYNKSVDWYALGVLIYEMLAGVPPFHQAEQPANPLRLYEDIMRGPGALRWPAFQPYATDLITRLMEGEPSRRAGNLKNGAGDVFTHAWFREVDWTKLLNRAITAPYLPKISGEGDASA